MEQHQQVWLFGPLGLLFGGFLFILTGDLEASLSIGLFFGMPTWFIGLLLFGLKADELLGVEGAFAYETIGLNDNEDG